MSLEQYVAERSINALTWLAVMSGVLIALAIVAWIWVLTREEAVKGDYD